MSDDSIEQLQKENAYFKKRTDALGAQNMKLDVTLSGVRYALIQKQKGFALLSKLQQTAGTSKDPSSIFKLAIEAVGSTLSVERTIVLTPGEQAHHFVPSQWLGYKEEEAAQLGKALLEFPPGFTTGTETLLVHKDTPSTKTIEAIRTALGLPYFVAVPVVSDGASLGIIVSGRLRENRPLWPPFDEGDIHTFQSLAGFIAASIQILRVGALQETDRLKTVFFANISHEFRTPITLTLGPLQGLLAGRYGEVSEAVRKQAETMMRNQQRLLGLINQILDLAKAEAGEMKVRPVRVRNINEVIERIVRQFQSMAEGRGLELKAQLDPALAAEDLYVDRDLFDKLLFNLISNAHKFTKKGSVTVTTERSGQELRISVTDTGVGIRADQLPYIFDRFRQADGSASREFAGTGIGLSLVKEIASLHKGDIKVMSEYGRGTTFRITLKFGRDHFDPSIVVENSDALADQGPGAKAVEVKEGGGREEVAAVNAAAEPGFTSGKPVVLYADDNGDLRGYVRDLLLPSYNVLLAADGEQGLEVARKHRPELILSDLMMPRMTGTEFCRAVREDADLKHTPFVLLTAKTSSESRVEGLEDGADDYLNKPFVEPELLARVRNLICLRQQQTRLKQELRAARDIQRALLPALSQRLEGASLEALYQPCEELSGDFFDVFTSAEGWVYAYLADVTSHGTVAAQITYLVKGLFRAELSRSQAPALSELVHAANRGYAAYGLDYDVGLQLLRYHPGQKRLEYVRGNAPAAVLLRNGDPVILQGGPGSGLTRRFDPAAVPPPAQSVELCSADRVFLFTDGCIEFELKDGKQLGLRRLVSALNQPSDDWRAGLLEKLTSLTAKPFDDDLTLLRLKVD